MKLKTKKAIDLGVADLLALAGVEMTDPECEPGTDDDCVVRLHNADSELVIGKQALLDAVRAADAETGAQRLPTGDVDPSTGMPGRGDATRHEDGRPASCVDAAIVAVGSATGVTLRWTE